MSDSIEVPRYRSNEIEVAKPKKEIRDFSFIATLECLKIVLVLSETVPVLSETVLVLSETVPVLSETVLVLSETVLVLDW